MILLRYISFIQFSLCLHRHSDAIHTCSISTFIVIDNDLGVCVCVLDLVCFEIRVGFHKLNVTFHHTFESLKRTRAIFQNF